jgi:hypothetical protein
LPPVDYVALRILRRLLPAAVVQSILGFGLGIESGLETRDPHAAADRYQSALNSIGEDITEKRILILGYGGYFGLAVSLLRRGAAHIVLIDPYAVTKHDENRKLAQDSSPFLRIEDNRAIPDSESISVIHNHVNRYLDGEPEAVDIILSSSVLEHIPDPIRELHILSRLTNAAGHHVHVIDLRDHFFKYPFEMLSFSESTWRRYLNPPSNLNRVRLGEYENAFRDCFHAVRVEILEGDREAFRRAKKRIRPEFLSGDEEKDSACKIIVVASSPIHNTPGGHK